MARGGRVVVAGAEVRVAADAVLLAPHHQHQLAVRLEADEAVDDLDAGLLHAPRPADVLLLVEARLQLDDDGDLLAAARPRSSSARAIGESSLVR